MIVNRGWLPRKLLDEHIAREKKEESGKISFVGVLRHGEVVCPVDVVRIISLYIPTLTRYGCVVLQKNNFTPDNDPKNRQFFYLDHEELADAMGVTSVDLPVIVDALGKSPQNGLRQNLFLYSLSATNSCTFCVTAVEGASGETTLDNPLRKSIASYLEFYMTPESTLATQRPGTQSCGQV